MDTQNEESMNLSQSHSTNCKAHTNIISEGVRIT